MVYACRSGVRTTRPSSSAVTLIWQDKPGVRLHVVTEIEHVLLHRRRLAHRGAPRLVDMDMAGGAGAGAAAFRLDAGNAVLDRRLHDGRSDLALDRAGGAFEVDEGDFRHAMGRDSNCDVRRCRGPIAARAGARQSRRDTVSRAGSLQPAAVAISVRRAGPRSQPAPRRRRRHELVDRVGEVGRAGAARGILHRLRRLRHLPAPMPRAEPLRVWAKAAAAAGGAFAMRASSRSAWRSNRASTSASRLLSPKRHAREMGAVDDRLGCAGTSGGADMCLAGLREPRSCSPPIFASRVLRPLRRSLPAIALKAG